MSEIRVDNITNEAGTGKPGFPNGITATGAALTDPEITGGIYLGGTGSANYLEDYEEGTWTPEYRARDTNFSSISYNNQEGSYTKIGNTVTVWGRISFSSASGGSGQVAISGLPFAISSSNVRMAGSLSEQRGWSVTPTYTYTGFDSSNFGLAYLHSGDTVYQQTTVGDMNLNDSRTAFCVTYQTDS